MSRPGRRRAFTLIELLIVASVISALVGLVIPTLIHARQEVRKAEAKAFVDRLVAALAEYDRDLGRLPGSDAPHVPDANSLTEVLEAVLRPRSTAGGDGSPYLSVEAKDIAVQEAGRFRTATPVEREEPSVPKYILDPWGHPYVVRENRSKRTKSPSMANPGFADVYSIGPNGRDETAHPENRGKGDDIGNL